VAPHLEDDGLLTDVIRRAVEIDEAPPVIVRVVCVPVLWFA
jgi:hypothetical protein